MSDSTYSHFILLYFYSFEYKILQSTLAQGEVLYKKTFNTFFFFYKKHIYLKTTSFITLYYII